MKLEIFFGDPWRKIWIKRFALYLGLFIAVTIIGKIALSNLNLIPTNIDNARYFISSMVQAQAAIVSLVVTLTLIAIQMTANSYTPRVIDVIKKNPDMWFLLTIYIEAILIGFFTLKELVGPDLFSVSFVFIWGIYSLGILFPYMIFTIDLLRPNAVINSLVGEINHVNINKKDDVGEFVEPGVMQPVFDVIHTSISRFDIPTTRIGLDAITDRILALLSQFNEKDRDSIIELYFSHVRRSISIALRNTDEGMISAIVQILASKIDKVEINMIKSILISEIGEIGKDSAEKKLENATISTIRSLDYIAKGILDGLEEEVAEHIIYNIAVIGQFSHKNELEKPILVILYTLSKIQSNATLMGMNKAEQESEMYINEFRTILQEYERSSKK